VVGGQLDFMRATAADSVEQARAGTIKAFAVMAEHRLGAVPGIPSVDEAGFALFAPKGTPELIIAKLSVVTMDGLADPAVRRRIGELGFEVMPRDQQTPEALAAFHKAEIEKWWPIIKAAGIKAQ
jgi:tripartite-type tricarboxylate transporter receptor subunit TctC